MLFRSVAEDDLDRVLACEVTEPVGWIPADRYRAELAARRCRPEWTWIAEDGDRILARALWWGRPAGAHPLALDCLYVHDSVPDRIGLAAGLLAAGHDAFRSRGAGRPPRYDLSVPNGRRDDPAVTTALGWRRAAAVRAGLTDELERLRYEWTPAAGLPGSSGRLIFRPEPGDDVFLSALRRVADGSLDVTTRRKIAASGAERQARADLDLYREMPGDREWWRLARTADGELAGLAMPNLSVYGPVVGYLGVVPELRGRRYIDDILAEITRFHAQNGARRITATTDVTNRPMAAAFERAGYRVQEFCVVLSAPAGR
ncbi:GNAT family N-acetyltransferase [Actinomadura scrupuli]|uniref:GNAT family N-acetyltransferase n=1 Tax=Actinomadura scrupuli TaxID=559629 RepID=UPI003D960395